MDIEAQIIDTIRSLPPERQVEILDYAEFLRQRTIRAEGQRPAGLGKGEFTVPDGFDDSLPDSILKEFES